MLEEFVHRLEVDYSEIRFCLGKKFCFRPPRTVIYEQYWVDKVSDGSLEEQQRQKTKNFEQKIYTKTDFDRGNLTLIRQYQLLLLHEVGHALLGHREFGTDVERLKMECAAWVKAEELAGKYGVEFDEELKEERLDSYRDWLYRKSLCPRCGGVRFSKQSGEYVCPVCDVMKILRKG